LYTEKLLTEFKTRKSFPTHQPIWIKPNSLPEEKIKILLPQKQTKGNPSRNNTTVDVI
jgi:hypothetical protein